MTPTDIAALPPARLPIPITRAVAQAIEASSADDAAMPTMTGHFSTFGDWYEVDSFVEGHFLERVGPRAFDKTIRESRDQMKVLYDHGHDPQIGNKILGPIEELRADDIGPAYTVPLFDTSYNRDLAPGLLAGAYGSSFRFSVEKDVWDHSPEASDHNPAGIPERTITEARVYEFGPVTFPANPKARASARSTTDAYYQRRSDPEGFEELLRSVAAVRTPVARTLREIEAAPPTPEPPDDTPEPTPEAPALEPSSPDTPRPDDQPADPPATPPDDSPDESPDEPRSTPVEYTNREEKAARVAELKEAIVRQGLAYPGVLPEDEQARYDADNAELDTLVADIAAWDQRVARNAELAKDEEHRDAPRDVAGKPVPFTVPGQINRKSDRDLYDLRTTQFRSEEERDQTWRDDAMRIAEISSFPNPNTDVQATRDRIANLLDHHDSPDKELARRIKVTGSPVYRRAFEKIISGRGPMSLTPEEQRGTALAVGVDATGGFTVPFAFDPTIIAIGSWSGAVNPYRRSCRVVSIVGTDTWNALTATAVVATRTTEAAAAIEQGPTFAQPQYVVKRVQGQITFSNEMAQDRTDLTSELAVLIQEAKDNEEEASFATGVGTTVFPLGVGPVNGTAGAYTSITTITSVTLAALDFDAVEAALPVRHRFGAQWFFNRLNIRKAQTLETTGGKLFGGNQYPAVGNVATTGDGNTGLRLLGYPVNESPTLPTAATANIVIGTLLAPSSYVIVDRVGMSINFIPFIFGSGQGNLVTGQQAIYFMWRNDARPINVDAGRTLRYLT